MVTKVLCDGCGAELPVTAFDAVFGEFSSKKVYSVCEKCVKKLRRLND